MDRNSLRLDNQNKLNALRSEVACREHIAELLSTADRLTKLAIKPDVNGLLLNLGRDLGSGTQKTEERFDLSELSVDRKLALFAFAAQLLEAQAAEPLKE